MLTIFVVFSCTTHRSKLCATATEVCKWLDAASTSANVAMRLWCLALAMWMTDVFRSAVAFQHFLLFLCCQCEILFQSNGISKNKNLDHRFFPSDSAIGVWASHAISSITTHAHGCCQDLDRNIFVVHIQRRRCIRELLHKQRKKQNFLQSSPLWQSCVKLYATPVFTPTACTQI